LLQSGWVARFGAAERRFDAVLIATGTRYRAEEVLMDVPGFASLAPEDIAYGPYAFENGEALRGKRVLIVGGGDNAYENARRLADHAAMVHLAIRTRPRAQQSQLDAVNDMVSRGGCRVLQAARVTSLAKGAAGLMVELMVAEEVERLTVDRIHVLTGYEPNTRFVAKVFSRAVADAISLDGQGYVEVDAECRSGHQRIYAAGDVSNPLFPCVVSAVAQGALAAKTIERDLRSALKT
jgi:thioredoxin reductase